MSFSRIFWAIVLAYVFVHVAPFVFGVIIIVIGRILKALLS